MTNQPQKTTKKAKNKRPYIFLGVGAINTLVDFCFYTFLMLTFFKNGSIILAGIISGTFALFFAFLTHSLITWKGSKITYTTLLKFVIFTGFGMWILRPLLLRIFSELSGLYNKIYEISLSIKLPLSYNFIVSTGAFGFMIILILIYNYLAYDRFVFSKKTKQTTYTDLENH